MATNVPAVQFNYTGVVVPQESAVLAGVQADIDTAFGGGVNPDLSTPQGQLATSLTAIIADKNAQIALTANQVNPDFADGRWQDAIGRIYFLTRLPAQGTVVQAVCTGAVNTVVPAGAQAQDTNGNIYACTQGGTIPLTGSITLPFACQTTGPIVCASGALSTIYKAIPGWDTISNPTAGVTGQNVETRAEFEARRRASIALNANGSVEAVRANVLQVPGVLSCYAIDNPTSAAVVNGDITLAPNSIYVAVVGGDPNAVAQAIWQKKSAGCSYNGNTSVTITDTNAAAMPYPTYTVKFQTPTNVPVNFAVQIKANPLLPNTINALITAAINNAFSGADGGPSAQIGSTLYASRFYEGVGAVDPNCEVVSIQIGTTTANQNYLAMGIDQMPTVGTITVTQV
jgi:hypothetical protein